MSLKLSIKNFKCIENKQIEIKKGFTLIEGESGIGKSTFLSSILFCLFGIGYSGKCRLKCEVKIEWNDIVITRQKNPNRLTFFDDKLYEDKIAQELIFTKFSKFFEMNSYIDDKQRNFVYMKPLEKNEFISEYCLSNYNILELKEKIKKKLKEFENEMNNLIGKKEGIEHILSIKTLKRQTISIPYKTRKNQLLFLETSIKKLTAIQEKIQKYENSQKIQNQKYTKSKENEKELEIYTLRLVELEKTNLELKIDENIDYKNEISVYENKYKTLQKIQRYNELNCKIESLIKQENNEKIQEQDNLKNKLWKEYTIEECEESIENYKLYVHLKNNLNLNVVKELQDAITEKEYLSEKIFSCPSCNVVLAYKNDTLKISERKEPISGSKVLLEDINQKIDNLKYHKKNIYDKFQEYSDISEEDISTWKYIEQYYKENIDISKKIKYLEKEQGNVSGTIKTLKKELDELDGQLKGQLKGQLNNDNINFVYNQLENLKKEYRDFLNSKKRKEEILKETVSIQNKINLLKTQNQSSLEIQKSINNLEEKISKKKSKETKIQKLIQDIRLYIQTEDEINEYKKYQQEILEFSSEILKKDEIIKRLKTLNLKINEAQSICIDNLIENINHNVQYYIDQFFVDTPFSVQISSFKENIKGNVKPQICLSVSKNGEERDFLDCSTGERGRINLAFVLAFSDISNSPFIVLDEPTGNLDLKSMNNVLMCLKEVSKIRPIIMCVHQQNTGIFDEIIKF